MLNWKKCSPGGIWALDHLTARLFQPICKDRGLKYLQRHIFSVEYKAVQNKIIIMKFVNGSKTFLNFDRIVLHISVLQRSDWEWLAHNIFMFSYNKTLQAVSFSCYFACINCWNHGKKIYTQNIKELNLCIILCCPAFYFLRIHIPSYTHCKMSVFFGIVVWTKTATKPNRWKYVI